MFFEGTVFGVGSAWVWVGLAGFDHALNGLEWV